MAALAVQSTMFPVSSHPCSPGPWGSGPTPRAAWTGAAETPRLTVSSAAPHLGPIHFQAPGDQVVIFFHIRNVKLIKETNTFNETYVGHLEGEDLQRVRCETRRLMESVKKEEKDNGLGCQGRHGLHIKQKGNHSRPYTHNSFPYLT